MKEAIEKFCSINNIIDPLQFGFQRGQSIFGAIYTLRSVIGDAWKFKKPLYVVSLDFNKAYDTVEPWILIQIMENYGFNKELINMIKVIYKEGSAIIISPNGENREKIKINRGLRQGDVMSPILYTIFINVLLEEIRRANIGYRIRSKKCIPFVAYADDITLLAKNGEEVIKMLEIIKQFNNKTGMLLNYNKYFIMTNSNEKEMLDLDLGEQIKIGDSRVTNRILGFWMNLEENWENMNEIMLKQIRAECVRIGELQITTKQKIKRINTVVIPKIMYRLNAVKLDKKFIKELDNVITGCIKKDIGIKKSSRN